MSTLAPFLSNAYGSYAYAYPHKTAYRPLTPSRSLADVWSGEDKRQLFLYVHVPFCEMRCGFCNLFTYVGSKEEEHERYVDALEREADAVAAALGPERRFSRLALGGGTPTFLSAHHLDRVMTLALCVGADARRLPSSVEVSPITADEERLAVLAKWGVTRVSIGVQSFVDEECRALGRPQLRADSVAALQRIRAGGFASLNVDLIYGVQGQTPASWRESIDVALSFEPEELYLYPLYVRPLTGLGRRARVASDIRPQLYREGKAVLEAAGYEQVSMRMFRRSTAERDPEPVEPTYCCQRDGMVGLGAGARSYTTTLHYSSEYAVARSGVKDIVRDYCDRDPRRVAFGFELGEREAWRRYVIQSLLQREGLRLEAFEAVFGLTAFEALPELCELEQHELGGEVGGVLRLNDAGIAASDAIGPWLASAQVNARMASYTHRPERRAR